MKTPPLWIALVLAAAVPAHSQDSKAWSLLKQADQANAEHRIQESIDFFDRARIAFRQEGDMQNWAETSRREAIQKMNVGDDAGSRELLDEAIAYRRKGAAHDPASLAAVLIARADLEFGSEQLEKSVADAKEGAGLLEKSAPDNPDVGTAYIVLGRAQSKRDRFADAEVWYEKAVAACRRIPDASSDLPRALSFLSGNLSTQGRFTESLKVIRQAQMEDPRVSNSAYASAMKSQEAAILMESGRVEEAEKIVRPALDELKKSLGAQSGPWIGSESILCELQVKGKAYAAALDCLKGITPSLIKMSAVESLAHVYALTGDAERELGRYEHSRNDLDLAEHWARKSPSKLPLGEVHYERGLTARAEGKNELARQELTQALSIRGAALGADHPKVVETQAALSKLARP